MTEYPFEDSQVQMFVPSETEIKEDDTQSAGDRTAKIVSEMSETPEEFNWVSPSKPVMIVIKEHLECLGQSTPV